MSKRQKRQLWPIELLGLLAAYAGVRLERSAVQHASCSCHMCFDRRKYIRHKERLSRSQQYLWSQQRKSSIAEIVEPRCKKLMDCTKYILIL